MSAASAQARARRYLDSAALLLNAGDYESSVSRAYYAMFYVARAVVRQRGARPKTHAGVMRQFSLLAVKPGDVSAAMAGRFAEAEDMRTLAEYAEARVLTREDAAATLTGARAFVQTVGALLADAG